MDIATLRASLVDESGDVLRALTDPGAYPKVWATTAREIGLDRPFTPEERLVVGEVAQGVLDWRAAVAE